MADPRIHFPVKGMAYRSYEQFNADIAAWLPHVPQVSAVTGVPRSGVLAATFVSFLRHIPLIPVESLMGNYPTYRPGVSRKLFAPKGPVLLIDDTCCMGRTKAQLRPLITHPNVIWGAVYASDKAINEKLVDVAGYKITTYDHTFQWNLFRDGVTCRLLTDFDGVLCPDWHRPSDVGEYLTEYESWINTVPVMHLPTFPLAGIVTARLEKYRPQTEAWLRRHGIKYSHLIMHPGEAHQRNSVRHKVAAYHSLKDKASGFVESCPIQSAAIAKATGWPVLCYATGELHNPTIMPPIWK